MLIFDTKQASKFGEVAKTKARKNSGGKNSQKQPEYHEDGHRSQGDLMISASEQEYG